MLTDKQNKVSIIIPGFNEGKNIYQNLQSANLIFSGFFENYEIIFINDGSTDNTLEEAGLAFRQNPLLKIYSFPENQGKGSALKFGTRIATGRYIVFMDADLELPPYQLSFFFDLLEKNNADTVIGSKVHPQSKIDYPIFRKILSYGYFLIIYFLFNRKFHDTQTGLKLFKSEVIKPIMEKIHVKRYAFDLEIMVMISKKGFKIIESPVIIEYKREQQRGRIRLKDIIQVFNDTLSILYRYLFTHDFD